MQCGVGSGTSKQILNKEHSICKEIYNNNLKLHDLGSFQFKTIRNKAIMKSKINF